jgi:hypothetical protein
MKREISESDWRIFRELHRVAVQRFCEKILAEAKTEIERPGKSPHEKYGTLFKLLRDGDRDMAQAFDDFRRSTALVQIGIIKRMGLFTDEELRRFSPATLQILETFDRP